MLVEWWEKHWKALLFVPSILFILSIAYFVRNTAMSDFPVPRSVELSGGKEITFSFSSINKPLFIRDAEKLGLDYRFVGDNNVIVDGKYDINETMAIATLSKDMDVIDVSTRTIGPMLGETFWRQAETAMLASLVLISIMVFILFKSFVPSIAVISSIIIDATVTTAIVTLMGYDFSIAMIGALLTIMSYSIDTDVLLTTKVSKHGGSFRENMKSALKTGFLITIAALVSAVTVFVVSSNPVLKDISIVLIVGLIVDFIVTWLQNAGIMKWWVDGKSGKGN